MNTETKTQITEFEDIRRAVSAVDWLEYRGCGKWTGLKAHEWVEVLEQAKNLAAVTKQEEPLQIAGHFVMMRSSGMGTGRQSRMEYAMTWGPVFIALAERDSDDMKHANLYVKIPGDACVIFGEARCRTVVNEILNELGFEVTQQTVSRLDVCLDVVGMALQDALLPACESGQMKGSLLKCADSLALHGSPRSGLSVGSRKSVRMTLYDKLHEAQKKGGEYLEAMKTHRWNGQTPKTAFRLEYQVQRAWLQRWQLSNVEQVMCMLPSIVGKLTDELAHPLFVVTDSVPDRKNKNQSRCGLLPEWKWLVTQFRQQIGECVQPLKAVDRRPISAKVAYQFIRGYATSAAAELRMPIDNFEDSIAVFRELHERNDGTDADWKQRWLQKAKKNGAYEEMTSFPFGGSN